MSIESAIQQKRFKNHNEKVIVNLLYTHNYLSNHINCLLKTFDLSNEQYNILRILRGQSPEPATINTLIDRMIHDNCNASRLVDKLYNKQLLERRVNATDRRQVDVLISKKGEKLLIEIDEKLTPLMDEIVNLDKVEATMLSDLLDALRTTNK